MADEGKILYLDDEETNLFIFRELFRSKFPVITTDNPFEALELLDNEEENIKVVISDMSMPLMNGLEFIEKASINHANKLFYILTAYDLKEEH